jgi:hypothetical protein
MCNAIFYNISVISWFSDLFQEKISEHPDKTTDLSQVTVGIPIFTEDSKNMNNADPTKYSQGWNEVPANPCI